jgi:HTH-type transcriptional regulator/antitoxin HigA
MAIMVKAKHKTRFMIRNSGDYMQLIRRMPLAHLNSRRDYDLACGLLDELSVKAERELTAGESAYLDVLIDLVERYEREEFESLIPQVGPVEALRFLVSENDMSASDLGRLLGNRALGSAVLSGKRQLSKAHIVKLSARFGVSPWLFLTA